MNRFLTVLIGCALLGACATSGTGGYGYRSPASGAVLMDGNTQYDILFTDPVCGRYKYEETTRSTDGKALASKPKNVYCRNQFDLANSGNRAESPQHKLLTWVNDPATKEIFFTYLSFRNKAVKNALCERVKKNDLRIRFVMSSTEDTTAADELKACNPKLVQYKTRGMEGDLGYAHNKIFIVLKNQVADLNKEWRTQVGDGDEIKMAYSSGNMTSGPVMHHENWHFVKTAAGKHFSQMHLCALYSEWNDKTGRDRENYMAAIAKCRADLAKAGKPEESDIKVFFVPGEGENQFGSDTLDNGTPGKSASNYMVFGDGKDFPGIRNADKIWIGAHRFFYSRMINELKKRMNGTNPPDLRITLDDDTYYKAMDETFGSGDTDPAEWYNVDEMVSHGGEVRLMETNHNEHQLHHSKYLLFFKGNKPASLICGAANLTGAGFKKNWENIYFVKIPHVTQAFATHYEKFWATEEHVSNPKGMTSKATPVSALPKTGDVSVKEGAGENE